MAIETKNPRVAPVATPDASRAIFDKAWDTYARGIKENILRDAKAEAGSQPLAEPEAYRALDRYFRPMSSTKPALWERVGQWITEHLFLLVAVLMTIVFGVLGWRLAGQQDQTESKAFLDIAKIFAGAIVGSAAGSGIVRSRSRSRPDG